MRFSNIDMSSPSLPMVPQWLKLAFGVKRALMFCSPLKKRRLKRADLECGPICRHKGSKLLPFLASPYLPRKFGLPMRHDRARATCVCEYTHCNASVSCRFFDVSCISTTRLSWGLSEPWLRRNWGKGTLV